MKFTPEVIAALQTLKDAAENDFERHRIAVLERDLTAPPVVEVIDDTHQKFDGVIYSKTTSNKHYYSHEGIQRAVYTYYFGEIPEGYEIHHIDLDATNNKIENLVALTKSEHASIHKPKGTLFPQIKPRLLICDYCGHKFLAAYPTNKRFCSEKCKRNYQNTRSIPKICKQCGNAFFATPNNKNQQFCSRSCKANWQHSHQISPLNKICPVCNNAFHAHNQKQVCCSHACANKLRARKTT